MCFEDTFYKSFGKMLTLLPDDFWQMDELRAIIYDMANVHDDIYFHLGMLYGFNLYKNFCDAYQDQYTETRDKSEPSYGDRDLLNSIFKQIKAYIKK